MLDLADDVGRDLAGLEDGDVAAGDREDQRTVGQLRVADHARRQLELGQGIDEALVQGDLGVLAAEGVDGRDRLGRGLRLAGRRGARRTGRGGRRVALAAARGEGAGEETGEGDGGEAAASTGGQRSGTHGGALQMECPAGSTPWALLHQSFGGSRPHGLVPTAIISELSGSCRAQVQPAGAAPGTLDFSPDRRPRSARGQPRLRPRLATWPRRTSAPSGPHFSPAERAQRNEVDQVAAQPLAHLADRPVRHDHRLPHRRSKDLPFRPGRHSQLQSVLGRLPLITPVRHRSHLDGRDLPGTEDHVEFRHNDIGQDNREVHRDSVWCYSKAGRAANAGALSDPVRAWRRILTVTRSPDTLLHDKDRVDYAVSLLAAHSGSTLTNARRQLEGAATEVGVPAISIAEAVIAASGRIDL
ncbi:hypothetical protein NOCARDAX2BIS_140134 [Nocardioides sp. AX2bis]|nr:hypothetical protein NOCARDAX2BIS_140134 [Nocardioides sp. AX2bis]